MRMYNYMEDFMILIFVVILIGMNTDININIGNN